MFQEMTGWSHRVLFNLLTGPSLPRQQRGRKKTNQPAHSPPARGDVKFALSLVQVSVCERKRERGRERETEREREKEGESQVIPIHCRLS